MFEMDFQCTVWRLLLFSLISLEVLPLAAISFYSQDENLMQDERYLQGKEKYELFQRESAMPKYSACWTNALNSLELGCKHLSDDTQHRLALKFSNCFLMKTGRMTYECSSTDLIETCTRNMAPEAYNVYTEFFTHTQNICFFLQAQEWQDETDRTIHHLSQSSAQVAKQIEDSSLLQTEVILKQNESIRNQQILIDRGAELKRTLEESTLDVHSMLREFKDSTVEQKALIFEVFDRLTSLQNIVMGEFTGFYSLIFYTTSVLVCYLLTSAPRTSSARFWLFLLMTFNVIIERMIVAWGVEQYQDAETGNIVDESTQLYARLWWCRKVFSVLSVAVWLRCAIMYQDFNKINNKLLVEIRKQNSDLKHLLQNGNPRTTINESCLDEATDGVKNATVDSVVNEHKPWNITDYISPISPIQDQDKNSTTGYESDSETSSVLSYNTTMTDRTFTASHLGDLSDSDSDSESSRSSLQQEVQDLRSATPVREMETYANEADISNLTDKSGAGSSKKKRGRPSGPKKRPLPLAITVPSYNLRSNRGIQKSQPNPIVYEESPNEFGHVVKYLANIAQRNQVKAQISVKRNYPGAPNARHTIFSSDDE